MTDSSSRRREYRCLIEDDMGEMAQLAKNRSNKKKREPHESKTWVGSRIVSPEYEETTVSRSQHQTRDVEWRTTSWKGGAGISMLWLRPDVGDRNKSLAVVEHRDGPIYCSFPGFRLFPSNEADL